MAGSFLLELRNTNRRATPATLYPKKQEQHMHHHIKPLAALSSEEIRALAIAAADRGDDLGEANVFEPGTPSHTRFRVEYLKRDYALAATA